MTTRTPDRSRLLRIAFLAILVFSAAQVVWWMVDQRRLVRLETERLEQAGAGVEELAELQSAHAHRLRQYAWEGGFFLLVLGACMAVIFRTLREESALRRRQQNFIASVTHELKSPLASLQLAAETIAMRRPEGDRLDRVVSRMRADVRRLEQMVGKILDTASLEAGRLQLKKERLELDRITDEIADEYADRARERGVAIERRVPDGLCIAADPAATRTIVRNLLDNALRATTARAPEGGTIALTGRAAPGAIELEIADTGVGFEPAEAERLFEKFYRLGDELRRTSRGTGLGLYVVRRFAELEHGRVTAASDGPGRGARFTVVWPACGEETT